MSGAALAVERALAALAHLALPLAALALRATLLLALAFLADRALRRAPAAARHALWVAAFAGLALLPGLGALLPGVALPVLPAGLVTGAADAADRADGEAPAAHSPAREHALTAAGGAERLSLARGSHAVRQSPGGGEAAGARHRDELRQSDPLGGSTPALPVDLADGSGGVGAANQPATPLADRRVALAGAAAAFAEPAGGLLVALAAGGTLVLLLYLLLGICHAWLLVRGARPLDGDARWRALLDEAVAEQRPRRAPALAVSEAVAVPVLGGLLRPTVVLPPAAGAWSDEERRRVLAHEVAHAARRDGLWQVGARAVAALYWWHPLAWRALSRLVLAAELACDDRVLAGGAGGPDYARQLLALARRPAGGRALAAPRPVTVAMARRPHLAVRIRALLDEARPRGPLPRRATAAGVAALLAGAVLLAPVRLGAADRGFAVDAPGLPLVAAGGAAQGGVGFGTGTSGGGGESVGSGSSSAAGPAADGAPASERAARSGAASPAARGGQSAGHGPDRAWIRESLARQRHRMTPLMRAVFAGDPAEVRRLLDAGADPDDGVRSLGTPLILAADAGEAEMVGLLLFRGADPNRAETGGERPGDLQRTPLGSAARSGDPATLDRLLAAGAAVDAAPPGDGTPLMIAARYGFAGLVRRLLDAGADPDARVRGDGTPLIEAARKGHLEVVDLLLAAGAPPDTAVVGDGNPLIVAAAEGHREVFDRLLAAGADPDVWVGGDESALYHAIARGDAWMVERLIAAGADLSGRWPEEEGPLELAAEAGSVRVLELLRQAGARR